MSTLKALLRKLCPDGVARKTLGECCIYLSKEALPQKELIEDSPYPVVNSSRNIYGRFNRYNNDADAVIIASHGEYAGFVSQISGKFWAGALCHPIAPKDNAKLYFRYLFHVLKFSEPKIVATLVARGSIPVINKSDMMRFSIPLPPVPMQEEIGRRLDAMQEAVEALESELALRRKQYEAVREDLINGANTGTECKMLGEIAHYSKDRCNPNEIDALHYVSVESLLQNKGGRIQAVSVPTSGRLVAFRSGDTLLGNIRPYLRKIWFADCNGGTNGDVLVIRSNDAEIANSRYLFHALLSERFFLHAISGLKEGKMPRGDKSSILKYSIPLPPPAVQKAIAAKLDAFDELVNVALPAEIAARRRAAEAVREECFAALEAAG